MNLQNNLVNGLARIIFINIKVESQILFMKYEIDVSN